MLMKARAGRLLAGCTERTVLAGGSSLTRRRIKRAASLPMVRPASTFAPFSSLSSFFSRQAPASTSQADPRTSFVAALESGRADQLYTPYHAIRSRVLASGRAPDSVTITSTEISAALNLLREARTLQEAELSETMYADITTVFGYNLKSQHHRSRLRAMSLWEPEKALEFVLDIDVGAREWNWVLIGLAKHVPELFEDALMAMHARGIEADVYTYNVRLEALRETEDFEEVPKVLSEMAAKGIQQDLATRSTLLLIYSDAGDLARGQQVADTMLGEELDRAAHDAMVAFACAKGGASAALQYIESQQRQQSFRPSRTAMASVVKASIASKLSPEEAVELVTSIERVARRDIGPLAWRHLIEHMLADDAPNRLARAFDLYCQARGRGAEIDISMTRPLIVALCTATPPRINEAMELYTDLVTSEANHVLDNPSSPRFTPTLSLYTYLLPAAARATPPAERAAITLLNDMRRRGLKFTSSTITSLTILLMRSSSNHQAAFKAYAHAYALDKTLLDAKGYAAILSCFINLSWPSSRLAPPTLFLEIVKDMRRAGYNPNAQVYTSLLHRYGANVLRPVDRLTHPDELVIDPPELNAWMETTLQAIVDIHTIIKLDPSVTVDVPLLNALMNAYNRVGAFAEAFEVWDQLVERRTREKPELYAASINIVLDACGYSEAHVKARRVWAWARRNHLTVERNWDAWVECLARLGQMQEATDVVCGEMKRRENGAPAPTVDTLRLLLRFSWQDKQSYRQVSARIQEEFPEMWEEVKGIVETRRSQMQSQ